jgi:peptidyl-prolyl cis-trans isomerase C
VTAVLGCLEKPKASSSVEPKQTQATTGSDRDRVVATIGKDKITVGMLSDELVQQDAFLRRRFSSQERRRAFLKSYVRFEVLAREARRLGLDHDPEVVRRVKEVMIERLMERKRASLVKMAEITDRDIEQYYNKNKQLYQRPAKVRASQIIVATRQEAREVLGLAREKPKDIRHFTELVQRFSVDPETKARQGDLDFFGLSDTDRIAKPVIDAVFALKDLWAVGGPIKTDKGWVVVMKTGQMAAVNRPLETESNRIKNQLFNERRLQAVEKYVAKLQAKVKVKIYEGNLAQVKVQVKAHDRDDAMKSEQKR